MEPLEKYFKENRHAFDDQEPNEGHFERFMGKMDADQGNKRFLPSRNSLLRIAAVVLLFITAGVFVIDFALNKARSTETGNGASLNPELRDALQYYETRTSDRLVEFRKLACCGEQQVRLNSLVTGELNVLEANSKELKQELSKDPENEMVQAALIKNHQMKEQVVENMIHQLKQRQ